MSRLELYEPIYEAIQNDELDDFEYIYIKETDDLTVVMTIYLPSLTQRLLLWFRGYRFLLTGSEAMRLYAECYEAEDFCQCLDCF